MGWFSKTPTTLVPTDVLEQLSPFGRASWDSKVNSRPLTDPRYDWTNFYSRVLPAYQTDLARAVAEIHMAAGDDQFAHYGGYRLIAEFEPSAKDPLYLDMMDAGLQMMYDQGLSSGHMTGYEAQRWIETHGDLRTSFDRLVEVAPPQQHATGVSLAPGETTMMARMGPDPLDNEFWLERIDDNTYGAFSMRQQNSDSVTLARYEEDSIGRSDTAEVVLRKLGEYLRLRPYWAHEQLEPFFTERREF